MEKVIKPIGIFQVTKIKNGNEELVIDEHNLVVNKASWILRDLMFGDPNKLISKIAFGDMNLTETDDLKNVDQPQRSDEQLINKLYEKEATKIKTTHEGNPAIKYSTTLAEDEFNGDGSQLITEYGLMNQSDELFSKKNRAGIYKDNETALRFDWTIVFN